MLPTGRLASAMRALLAALLALVAGSIGARGLRIDSIQVPPASANGSQVDLSCNFDLNADQLYTVKWYKNYVEFYRFQPANRAEGQKDEFELDGIKLNLDKCNSTHIQLAEVSLASEGTYKCEVSADSPSFATLSAERPMKIYVLAKLKLSIVDNSPASSRLSGAGSPPTGKGKLVEPNELLNVTCTSSASRPAARIQWLLNELPITNASGWISEQVRAPDLEPELRETRSTLALQPASLANILARSAPRSLAGPQQQVGGRQVARGQQFRLRCVARMSLEFEAESSLRLTGGASSARPSQRPPTAPPLPAPVPLGAHPPSQQEQQQANKWPAGGDAALRWPRPAGAAPRGPTADPVSLSTLDWLASDSETADVDQARQTFSAGGKQWSARQLRAQAQHIERLLVSAHPNDLQAPLISARTLLEPEPEPDDPQQSAGQAAVATSAPDPPDEATQADAREAFELNELVQLTCEPGARPSSLSTASLRLSWLINASPVWPLGQVDAFNGSHFVSTRHQTNEELARPADGKWPARSRLVVELSASLVRLKELSVACRATLEQPLIELEAPPMALLLNWAAHEQAPTARRPSGAFIVRANPERPSERPNQRRPGQPSTNKSLARQPNGSPELAGSSSSASASSITSMRPTSALGVAKIVHIAQASLLALTLIHLFTLQ